jgi:hypothetical protein
VQNGGRRIQREPGGKNRQPAQQAPFGLGQKIVAPVERCAQRLMTRQRRTTAGRQQPEAILQA